MPTTCVGVNEDGFTLIISMSSYINPEWIYGSWVMGQVLLPVLEVLRFGIQQGGSSVV